MGRNITLRPAGEADEEFLCKVYSSTRSDEVAAFGWDEVQRQAFLQMQFTMRQRAYKMQYPDAEHSIVLLDETPVGTFIVDRNANRISLVEIAILPEFRNNGIATYLIQRLQQEASASGSAVVLHVDKINLPAKKLYHALGFIETGETQFSYELQWRDK